ncbi:MAG: TIGR03545 family protein [Bdellovibrionaceae bacterium]|nr:TIGR03545 family protein [Bdellovibrionales bacterium]MCB9084605.1 TIGR03545 family protein [Pseudobdellovibrionaceae bacterium]
MTNEISETTKKPKKKGPIRFEAIIPVVIVCALTGLYFSFLFDSNLRHLIEFGATYVHGAEVNVGSVRTSVLGGSFSLKGLQVTDKEDPNRNLVQIGEIRFGLLWDALLRAKFVVDEATIDNIQAYSPRKRPGRIIPKTESAGKSQALAKLESGVLDQTKEDYEGNVLGDLAHIVEGADPKDQAQSVEDELKASIRMKELETTLKEKQKAWDERLKSLPKSEELKDFERRLKAVKVDTSDPKKFAASLKEIKALKEEADQKIKLVKDTSSNLDSDLKMMDQSFKELDDLVKQDIKDLENRFKIPNMDMGDFSKKLFGKMFADKLVTLNKYMAIGREYMPPKKTAEEKAAQESEKLVPTPRGTGKNYKFPVTKGYPLFWLKKGRISSEPGQSEYSGKIEGEIRDVTSNPVQLGRPTVATVKGDFPKQQIYGFDALITLDHTTENPKDEIRATVGSFPVGVQKISDSNDVKFLINKSQGHSKITAIMEKEQMKVWVNNSFKEMDYDIDAKSGTVKEILTNVMAGIPEITVDAKASGTWSKLNMSLRSNLGEELSKGFKKQIQAKIDAARAKLKAMVDEKIGAERAKLTAEFDKIKGKINKDVDRAKGQVDGAKKQAEDQLAGSKKSAEDGQKKKVEKEGKKLLKDLKKKLKFK